MSDFLRRWEGSKNCVIISIFWFTFIVFSPKKAEKKTQLSAVHINDYIKNCDCCLRGMVATLWRRKKNQMNTKASSGGSYGSLMKGKKSERGKINRKFIWDESTSALTVTAERASTRQSTSHSHQHVGAACSLKATTTTMATMNANCWINKRKKKNVMIDVVEMNCWFT